MPLSTFILSLMSIAPHDNGRSLAGSVGAKYADELFRPYLEPLASAALATWNKVQTPVSGRAPEMVGIAWILLGIDWMPAFFMKTSSDFTRNSEKAFLNTTN